MSHYEQCAAAGKVFKGVPMSSIDIHGLASLTSCPTWRFEPMVQCGLFSTSEPDAKLTFEADGGYIHGSTCVVHHGALTTGIFALITVIVIVIALFVFLIRHFIRSNAFSNVVIHHTSTAETTNLKTILQPAVPTVLPPPLPAQIVPARAPPSAVRRTTP